MRVHPNQVNLNAQLDAMYAAQKAEAKREAARTRKKLMEFASKLAAEADAADCVIRLGEQQESREESGRQERYRKNSGSSADDGHSISDWA